MTTPFEFKPGVRQNVSLLIGICGASGSGKSRSALELATGLAGPDGKIAAIDTEAGRLLHYASGFKFDHGDMRPPFSPEHYLEAVDVADHAGYSVIIIDSLSHEWESEGGMHDMHDRLLSEQVEQARKSHTGNWEFDENKTRERLSIGAWREPKTQHKKFVNRLLQCRAHLVLCLRADEKMRIEKIKDDRGRERTVIVQAKDMPPNERWSPICERRLPYELTVSLILAPQNPGVPIPIKLQDQHRPLLPLDQQISSESGRLLAEWARGDVPPAVQADISALLAEGDAAASMSTLAPLEAFWKARTKAERDAIGRARLDEWKARVAAFERDPTGGSA